MFAYKRKYHLVTPRLESDEVRTLANMAFSLPEMDKLRLEGKPISNQNLSNDYYDGSVTDDVNVAFDRKRGVDLNDAWNASKTAELSLRKAHASKIDINPSNS